ncbi:hypothetical protein CMI48_02175 [Candidatus Pacearchaeota archaeon]|nr:hypothetical protein [Candidatus Pacearchaeota archaeon]
MDLELGLDDVVLRDEDEGPMVEAIDAGKIVTVSEDHALREGLPILKHLAEQAVEPEVAQNGLVAQDVEKDLLLRMTEMRQAADQASHPMKKELVPHWHWHISQARRRKGLTRKQFGQVAGVSEQQMKLLENGILPPNASMLVTKVQDGLGVRLRKDTSADTAQPMRELVELRDEGSSGSDAGNEIDSEEKLLSGSKEGVGVGGEDIELLDGED